MRTKLYLLMFVAVVIFGLLFWSEYRSAQGIIVKPSQTPYISTGMANIPLDDTDPVLGNPGAPLTVIMFADLDCDNCKQIYNSVANFVQKHPQDVRLIWKSAPSTGWFSKDYTFAHQAAYCANKFGKFWDFINLAYQTNNLDDASLQKIAQGLKLNLSQWWLCANSAEAVQKISDNRHLLTALGIDQLPAIFINNRLLNLEAQNNLEDTLTKLIAK